MTRTLPTKAHASSDTSAAMTSQRFVCDELRGIIWRCQREQRLIRRALAPPCQHIDWWYRRTDTGRLACWSCGS